MWFYWKGNLTFYGILNHRDGKDDSGQTQELLCRIILCPLEESPKTTMASSASQDKERKQNQGWKNAYGCSVWWRDIPVIPPSHQK